MKSPVNYIKEIFVEESCADLPYTREILARAGGRTVTILPDGRKPMRVENFGSDLNRGKQILLLGRNRGHFFKPCPATREYTCCEYQVVNTGMNCPMDCVYCILQAYLNNPWLSFFVNVDDMIKEIDAALKNEPDRFWRIGTGEFTDSLAIDRLTGLSSFLVPFMAEQTNAILELKTKSAEVDNLKDLDHRKRTVVSWSLNMAPIMQNEEIRTATMEERLEAALKCISWGYKVGFHFDPIVYQQGWKEEYQKIIDALYQTVPSENIAWISMGCLRYLPFLKNIATDRFRTTRMFSEEFVEGLDGKSRYFRTVREEMYSHLLSCLQKYASPDTCIYLCMESDEIWRKVFGYSPGEKGGLAAMLDKAACPDNP
jgi:spore photoproduct lyase